MIFEDEDELGYWTGSPEPPPMQAMSSLIVCNAILPKQEQDDIEAAAINAHEGDKSAARKCRKLAGYDRLRTRPDADRVR